jgi:hypothetical protein
MFKQFRSIDGDIVVSSTTGHSAVITKHFSPIHKDLWAAAYSAGAVAEDMGHVKDGYIEEKKLEAANLALADRVEVKEIMKAILDDPTNYLDKSNTLIYSKVVSLTKRTYKKALFNEIWTEIVEESKA